MPVQVHDEHSHQHQHQHQCMHQCYKLTVHGGEPASANRAGTNKKDRKATHPGLWQVDKVWPIVGVSELQALPGLGALHRLQLLRRAQFMLPQLLHAQSPSENSPSGPCARWHQH
jgi:hypothetical protein